VADYHQAYGEAPKTVTAVAVMVDTDDTSSQATAWFADIELASSGAQSAFPVNVPAWIDGSVKRAARLAAVAVLAVVRPVVAVQASVAQGLPDHAGFSAVLGEHVRGARVDYAALQAAAARLQTYLGQLAAADPAALAAADRNTQLAFWINAYNACMLKQVIDHYPLGAGGSVRQISGVFKRRHCRVAGTLRSQDDIEHGILRPTGDSRIHFAVNCAARSCPALAAEAYIPEQVERQLDAAVRRFVSGESQFQIVRGDHPVLRVNKILDWYSQDFGGPDGVKRFLARYVPPELAAYIQRADVRLRFFGYDWTLNDVER
jgi:hypothetical protein